MKNNLGQKLTVKVLRSIWADLSEPYVYDRTYTRKDWLDEKAMHIYYARLAAARARNASKSELMSIDAQDVSYTTLDEIKRQAWNTKIGQFFYGLYHWLTEEPDYSSLYPCG